jgi:hypothetical protein
MMAPLDRDLEPLVEHLQQIWLRLAVATPRPPDRVFTDLIRAIEILREVQVALVAAEPHAGLDRAAG